MLTPDQLNQIDQHLRKENWLLNEDLIAELTDHYAAGIDDRMAHGLSFSDALRAVHTDFGGRKALLQMEEEAQKQKFIRYRRSKWQLVRSFTQGPRWYASVGLFAVVLLLNVYSGQYKILASVNLMGFFFLLTKIIGNLLANAFRYILLRRGISPAGDYSTAPIFNLIYLFCFLTLGIEQYGRSFWDFFFSDKFSDTKVIMLVTALETLCLLYYTIAFICLRQTVINKRKILV